MTTLVDANVLLDLATNDAQWASWSAQAIEDLTLLTRDGARYRSYFPHVRLVAPS